MHLIDSQVVVAILTKGRTSSRKLQPLLGQWNSLLLASDLYAVLAFVSSEFNPADFPSRKVHNGVTGAEDAAEALCAGRDAEGASTASYSSESAGSDSDG